MPAMTAERTFTIRTIGCKRITCKNQVDLHLQASLPRKTPSVNANRLSCAIVAIVMRMTVTAHAFCALSLGVLNNDYIKFYIQ